MSFRLTTRIIAPTVGASVGLLLLGGLAAWYLHRLQQNSSELLVTSVTRLRAAEELEIISHELRNELNNMLFPSDAAQFARVAAQRQAAQHWMDLARQQAKTTPEQDLLARLAVGYEHFFREFQRLAVDPQKSGQQRQELLAPIREVTAREILQPAREYRGLNRKLTEDASQRNQAIADRMGLGLLLLGLCGAVAGLLVGYGMARGIQRSMVELSVPIRDAGGKLSEVVGPIAISSDATFQELELALENIADRVGTVVERLHASCRAAFRAEQLAALGQLAAGLAHELRNPLTSIKLLVQPEAEGAGPVLSHEDLVVVRQEIERLELTLQTFLDYARPPRLETRPTVVRRLLQQTVDFVAGRARQVGVDIVTDLPEQILEVEADPGQLRQVLLNLLLNALEASPHGGQVTVRMTYQPPRELTIEVADQGVGLPAELGARIFEPFITTKDSGTGLGLPICKRIVEEHGGQITARNRPGGGAAFAITFPLGRAGPAAAACSADVTGRVQRLPLSPA